MTGAGVIDKAKRAARRQDGDDVAEWVGRSGWLARAVVYAVMALIVVQVALHHGSGGEKADQKGALQAVAERPFGSALMVVLAVGFLAFAAGRVFELTRLDDDGWKRAGKFVSRSASAVSQLSLAFLALTFIGGGSERESGPTAKILVWPFGSWIVGAIGLTVMAVGGGFVIQGLSRRFMKRLEDHKMSKGEEKTALALGVAGLVSRGIAFLLAGYFVFDAARDFDPQKASGLDSAFRAVAQEPWGSPVLYGLAAGLACFAAYCGFMGRYRDLKN